MVGYRLGPCRASTQQNSPLSLLMRAVALSVEAKMVLFNVTSPIQPSVPITLSTMMGKTVVWIGFPLG